MSRTVTVSGPGVVPVSFSNELPLSFMCGPCAIESYEIAMRTAELIKSLARGLGLEIIYKSSYDKANRTSALSKRGLGLEEGLRVLEAVRKELSLPVITDIHTEEQAGICAEVVDALQIPAFLCRQTDLIIAAARTGKPINIKKGQFLAPDDINQVAEKATSTGNYDILLTERGTSFGYKNLVSDMRSLRIMAETEFPVIFDATHSVQLPGGAGSASSGDRRFVEPLARAAVAVGIAGVFIETHPDPARAISDGPNQIPLDQLKTLLTTLVQLDKATKALPYGEIS